MCSSATVQGQGHFINCSGSIGNATYHHLFEITKMYMILRHCAEHRVQSLVQGQCDRLSNKATWHWFRATLFLKHFRAVFCSTFKQPLQMCWVTLSCSLEQMDIMLTT